MKFLEKGSEKFVEGRRGYGRLPVGFKERWTIWIRDLSSILLLILRYDMSQPGKMFDHDKYIKK
ncbi:hypothetical protein D9X91_12935 [Falsibacillus albus]|uniref:Uncharacterized protein n=1 Tax=Falsibacillus albus TaxID=2478915 RepID=A0A3L7JYU4_9BACI|nr:hypothetical protein D9X91_12935 [Falsibacillus albus]